jgi:hypothetical protein
MQLREMLTALRAECGLSTNVAHGLNDRESMVYLLDRTQLDLWEAWDWPFLTVDRDIALGAADHGIRLSGGPQFRDHHGRLDRR